VPKQQISIRISDAGKSLLDRLQERLGVTQAANFELSLRELATKQGIPVPDAKRREGVNSDQAQQPQRQAA
jgi:antitoxin component of RelBE/YafQ-DinJ toxin-antitoxin module